MDIKTRSIRADESTLEKFKALSEEFESQGDCLSQLITSYEINKAKHILTDVKADIADYQSHIESIQQSFLHILELNNNAESRIRTEFQTLLTSKDNTIIDLQTQLQNLTAAYDDIKSECKTKTEQFISDLELKNKTLSDVQSELASAKQENINKGKIIADKEIIISNLNEKIALHEELTKKNNQLNTEVTELQNQLNIKNSTEKSIRLKISELEDIIKTSEEKHKNETELLHKQFIADQKQAVFEAKEQMQEKIEKQMLKIETLLEEISKLKAENMKLSKK